MLFFKFETKFILRISGLPKLTFLEDLYGSSQIIKFTKYLYQHKQP